MKEDYILSTNINDLHSELWEFIPGYGFRYQISNYGRVKSLIKNRHQILLKTISGNRYKVLLYNIRGRAKNESIGRLVASLFIESPKEDSVLKYKDGNRLNDRFDNLFWSTYTESIRTAKNKHMYSHKGEFNGMAKLNNQKVLTIRKHLDEGRSVKGLSEEFGVSVDAVRRIKTGKTWKDDNPFAYPSDDYI